MTCDVSHHHVRPSVAYTPHRKKRFSVSFENINLKNNNNPCKYTYTVNLTGQLIHCTGWIWFRIDDDIVMISVFVLSFSIPRTASHPRLFVDNCVTALDRYKIVYASLRHIRTWYVIITCTITLLRAAQLPVFRPYKYSVFIIRMRCLFHAVDLCHERTGSRPTDISLSFRVLLLQLTLLFYKDYCAFVYCLSVLSAVPISRISRRIDE